MTTANLYTVVNDSYDPIGSEDYTPTQLEALAAYWDEEPANLTYRSDGVVLLTEQAGAVVVLAEAISDEAISDEALADWRHMDDPAR